MQVKSLILSLFLIVFLLGTLQAETVDVWKRVHGGTGDDRLFVIKKVPTGGYIAAGTTTSAYLGNSTNQGGYDMYVVKLNDAGIIEWELMGGTPIQDAALDVSILPDGSFIVVGLSTNSTIERGNALFYRITPNGVGHWVKDFADIRSCLSSTLLQDGNILIGCQDRIMTIDDMGNILFQNPTITGVKKVSQTKSGNYALINDKKCQVYDKHFNLIWEKTADDKYSYLDIKEVGNSYVVLERYYEKDYLGQVNTALSKISLLLCDATGKKTAEKILHEEIEENITRTWTSTLTVNDDNTILATCSSDNNYTNNLIFKLSSNLDNLFKTSVFSNEIITSTVNAHDGGAIICGYDTDLKNFILQKFDQYLNNDPPGSYINIAKGKTCQVSSQYDPLYSAQYLVDGHNATVWGSDDKQKAQWFYVDLGTTTPFSWIKLEWYSKYFAKKYSVWVSDDTKDWRQLHNEKEGYNGINRIYVNGNSRYVGVYLEEPNSIAYGVEEFSVYQDGTAQPTWETGYGGSGIDRFTAVKETVSGYIAVGTTNSTDIIPNRTNKGGYDAYIAYLDTHGKLIWQDMQGSTIDDTYTDVIETKNHGFLAVGKSGIDALIVKYDAQGLVKWAKTYPGLEEITRVEVLAGSGYLLSCTNKAAILDENGNIVINAALPIQGPTTLSSTLSLITSVDGGYIAAGKDYSFGAFSTAGKQLWSDEVTVTGGLLKPVTGSISEIKSIGNSIIVMGSETLEDHSDLSSPPTIGLSMFIAEYSRTGEQLKFVNKLINIGARESLVSDFYITQKGIGYTIVNNKLYESFYNTGGTRGFTELLTLDYNASNILQSNDNGFIISGSKTNDFYLIKYDEKFQF